MFLALLRLLEVSLTSTFASTSIDMIIVLDVDKAGVLRLIFPRRFTIRRRAGSIAMVFASWLLMSMVSRVQHLYWPALIVPHMMRWHWQLFWKRSRHRMLTIGGMMGLWVLHGPWHGSTSTIHGWVWRPTHIVWHTRRRRRRRWVSRNGPLVDVAMTWMLLWLLLMMMMLLLLRRSLLLLLARVLARVGLVREMLVLRIHLLDLVRILRATWNHDLRLHRLLKSGRFGLQYDVYTHELTFATVD